MSLDPDLGYLPFTYLRVSSSRPTPTYSSESDARDGKHSSGQIEPGFDYVSYLDCSIKHGKAVFYLSSGVFMRGGSDCGQIATSPFHGLAFYRTPERPFGWVLGGTYAAPAPGETEAHTQTWVNRYQVVQIYDSADAAGTTWYEIAPGQWLEARLIAKVVPDTTRPGSVEGDRWISINLFEQTLTAYDNGRLVFATLVSSGLPGWWTRPGDFQIADKLEETVMSGAFAADRSDYYYLQDVPWTMYFDEARALHGAYWHNGFGYPRSHGCVNLSPTDSHWLYNWADEGTWVHVWDPSGKTPTDDASYGAGGA
jgi:lipoprotein-anchoring transpeptidase ErfK/SrfK